MSIAFLGTFPMTEAEGVLVELWCEWEKNGDKTPVLRCEFHAGGQVSLWLARADEPAQRALSRTAVVTGRADRP